MEPKFYEDLEASEVLELAIDDDVSEYSELLDAFTDAVEKESERKKALKLKLSKKGKDTSLTVEAGSYDKSVGEIIDSSKPKVTEVAVKSRQKRTKKEVAPVSNDVRGSW